MINSRLKSFIQKSLAVGECDEEIIKKLLDADWEIEEIKEAIVEVKSSDKKQVVAPSSPFAKFFRVLEVLAILPLVVAWIALMWNVLFNFFESEYNFILFSAYIVLTLIFYFCYRESSFLVRIKIKKILRFLTNFLLVLVYALVAFGFCNLFLILMKDYLSLMEWFSIFLILAILICLAALLLFMRITAWIVDKTAKKDL